MADTPGLSAVYPTWQEALREAATRINAILGGKINNTGAVTLTASDTTTTVTDKRVTENSAIVFMPTTANAAAEKDSLYVGTITSGTSFVITHANTADVDKTFRYAILG